MSGAGFDAYRRSNPVYMAVIPIRELYAAIPDVMKMIKAAVTSTYSITRFIVAIVYHLLSL